MTGVVHSCPIQCVQLELLRIRATIIFEVFMLQASNLVAFNIKGHINIQAKPVTGFVVTFVVTGEKQEKLTAVTHRGAAFVTHKVVQIIALGLLCTLITVTQFINFLSKMDGFFRVGHI